MNKGEIWVSNGLDGQYGALIGDRAEAQDEPERGTKWACILLTKTGPGTYTKHAGRVSTVVDPSAFYTGEGFVFEEEYSKYNRLTAPGEVRMVDLADNPAFTTTTSSPPTDGYVVLGADYERNETDADR